MNRNVGIIMSKYIVCVISELEFSSYSFEIYKQDTDFIGRKMYFKSLADVQCLYHDHYPPAMLNYANLFESESDKLDFTVATCHSVIGQPLMFGHHDDYKDKL